MDNETGDGNSLPRTPPASILRELRREVGFGCAVSDCDGFLLKYHHFDPPWAVAPNHNPEGIIALCAYHADLADGGAFTTEQLRALKAAAGERRIERRGRFEWLRNDLLAIVGGNIYYRTPTIVSTETERMISRRRPPRYSLHEPRRG